VHCCCSSEEIYVILCVRSEIHGIVSKNTCAPEREKQCRLKGVPGFDAISKQTAENDWS
jgi:hypothetical protein